MIGSWGYGSFGA